MIHITCRNRNGDTNASQRPTLPHHQRSRVPARIQATLARRACRRAPRPHRADRRPPQLVHHAACPRSHRRRRERRVRNPERRLPRPLARHTHRLERPLLHERHTHHRRLQDNARLHPRLRRRRYQAIPRRRRNPHGQAANARVRAGRDERKPARRPRAQSMGHHAHHWRLQRRLWLRRSCRAVHGGARQRHWRLYSHPGVGLRHRWTQAHIRQSKSELASSHWRTAWTPWDP